MTDFLSQIESRISETEKKFHDRGEQIAKLTEQGASINREVARLQSEQLEIRGAWQELKKMRDENLLTELDSKKVEPS